MKPIPEQSQNKLTTVIIFALFLLMPIVHHSGLLDPVMPIRNLTFGLFTMVFLGATFKSFKNSPIQLKSHVIWLLLGLILLSGISIFLSINKGEAIFHWVRLTSFVGFGLILYQYAKQTKGLFGKVSVAVSISHLVLIFVAINQHVEHGFNTDQYKIFSWLAHKNQFSIYLLLTIPFLLEASRNKNIVVKILAFLGLLLGSFYIVFTRTRSVWLAILIGGIGLFIYLVSSKSTTKKMKRLVFILVGAGILIGSLGIVSSSELRNKVKESIYFSDYTTSSANSAKVRVQIWKSTLNMIKEHPFGVGGGNWRIHYPKYSTTPHGKKRDVFIQRAHNEYLQLAAEFGIAPILILIVLLTFLMIHLFQQKPNLIYGSLVFSIIGFIITCLFSFPTERPLVLLLFVTLIVFASLPQNTELETKKGLIRIHVLGVYALIIPFGLFIYISTIRFTHELEATKSAKYQQSGNKSKVIKHSGNADNFFYSLDPFSAPHKYYVGMEIFQQGKHEEGINTLEEALEANPYHIHTLNNLGSMHLFLEHYQEAKPYLNQSIQLDSSFHEAVMNLSLLYIKTKQYEESAQLLFTIQDRTIDKKFYQLLRVTFNNLEHNIKTNKVVVSKTNLGVENAYFSSRGNRKEFERKCMKVL